MKKIRILSVLTLLLMATLLFTSCGKGKIGATSSFDKVLNPDYDVSVDAVSEAVQLEELDGYLPLRYFDVDDADFNEAYDLYGLEIFYNLDLETGDMTYKVYNLFANKVVLTLDDENTDYDFETGMYEEFAILGVSATVFTAADDPEADINDDSLYETTYYAYDAMGTKLSETDDEDGFDEPFWRGEMVVFDLVAYNVDEDTGAFEKEMDIPEYILIDKTDCYMDWNDEYYYVFAYSESTEYREGTLMGVYVYDHSFNYVSSWNAPAYATEKDAFVLNNGDVLIQYSNVLDEEAKEYDYYQSANTETVKYDLVTLVMKAKNGNVKDIDMKYFVSHVEPNHWLYDEEDDNNKYNDSFDNIAYIHPIVNQRIDDSEAAQDVVLMSDKGKIKKSLKLVDGQKAVLPTKLADDVYMVEMLNGGYALVNIDGDILKMINSGARMQLMGQYLVTDKNIYDFDLEVIYDLKENDAGVLGVVDGVLFVQAGDYEDDEFSVYSFCDGEKKTVYTYSADAEENDQFYMTKMGYVLIDSEGSHVYYNAYGKELITTDGWLTSLNVTEDAILCSMIPTASEEFEATYYIFKK